MTRSEARRLAATTTLEQAHALAEAALRRRPRKSLAPGKSKAERKADKRASDRKVYAAVVARDQGCTASRVAFGPCQGLLTIDHQWGRGKEPTRVENCRRLCEKHHRMKTDSDPDRLKWLADFACHAQENGYLDESDKALRLIALERAQHPEHERTGTR